MGFRLCQMIHFLPLRLVLGLFHYLCKSPHIRSLWGKFSHLPIKYRHQALRSDRRSKISSCLLWILSSFSFYTLFFHVFLLHTLPQQREYSQTKAQKTHTLAARNNLESEQSKLAPSTEFMPSFKKIWKTRNLVLWGDVKFPSWTGNHYNPPEGTDS